MFRDAPRAWAPRSRRAISTRSRGEVVWDTSGAPVTLLTAGGVERGMDPSMVTALLRENRFRVRLWLVVAVVVALMQFLGSAAGAAEGGGPAGVTPPRLVASEPIERPSAGGAGGEGAAQEPGAGAVDVEMDVTAFMDRPRGAA